MRDSHNNFNFKRKYYIEDCIRFCENVFVFIFGILVLKHPHVMFEAINKT